MRKYLCLVVLGLFMLTLGCTRKEDAAPIRIGAIFDLSGPTANTGTPYAEGILGYVEWVNARGGLDGRPIELVWEDYAYNVQQAEALYTRFVQEEGIVAFQGWGTGDTEALRERIVEDQIPFMSASYSHVLGDPTEAPYNFLVGTSYSHQFFIVLDWIASEWERAGKSGTPKVALLHHPSPFGISPWKYGGEAYAAQLGFDMRVEPMQDDIEAQLHTLKTWNPDYIVLQTVASPAARAVVAARTIVFLDAPIICLNWCANEILVQQATSAAEGVIGVFPFAPPTVLVPGLEAPNEFLAQKGLSLREKGVHYGQGWWTMAIMAEGIRRALRQGTPLTGARIKAALETLQDFDTGGVTVPITFTPHEHYGTEGVQLFHVQNRQWQQKTGVIYVNDD